jgi:hypothetical protein
VITLFGIVTPVRSGTTWYANLFTVDDVFCFHELTSATRPYPVNTVQNGAVLAAARDHDFEQVQRRRLLDASPEYFARLLELGGRGVRVAGNSEGLLGTISPGVWLLWPSTRFVFSARNGINQVNSTFIGRELEGVVRDQQAERFGVVTAFEVSCRRWVATVRRWSRSLEWLTEHGASCTTTTLENITTDVAELERVWTFVVGEWERYAERAVSLMSRPMNVRMNEGHVVRSSEEVWEQWNDDQRNAFVEICGETQRRLGYAIPGQAG